MSQSRSTPKVDCGYPTQQALVHFGPTPAVQIGFDEDFRPGRKVNLPEIEYRALIDTGAFESCIDSSLATALRLPVVDRREVSGALGKGQVNVTWHRFSCQP